MQVVAADVGNSSIKLMRATLDPQTGTTRPDWPDIRSLAPRSLAESSLGPLFDPAGSAAPCHWYVSSVNQTHAERLRELAEHHDLVQSWKPVHCGQIDLVIEVESPAATGIDRLLAAEAAKKMHAADSDLIVIDCGTAMTIDLVTRDNVFRGGVILAGPETNLQALAAMTSALPDLSGQPLGRPESPVGRSTQEALMAGAWLNGLGAIRETVARYSELLEGSPVVVGTGGGLGPWRDDLPDTWIVVDNLVLEGLFRIAHGLIAESRSS